MLCGEGGNESGCACSGFGGVGGVQCLCNSMSAHAWCAGRSEIYPLASRTWRSRTAIEPV